MKYTILSRQAAANRNINEDNLYFRRLYETLQFLSDSKNLGKMCKSSYVYVGLVVL